MNDIDTLRHEAAHAVVCIALGGRVDRVTAKHTTYYLKDLSLRDMAIIALAPAQYLQDHGRSLSRLDMKWVRNYAGNDPDRKTLQSLLDQAVALVDTHRATIEALAKLLEEKEELSGGEVKLLFLMAAAARESVKSAMSRGRQ